MSCTSDCRQIRTDTLHVVEILGAVDECNQQDISPEQLASDLVKRGGRRDWYHYVYQHISTSSIISVPSGGIIRLHESLSVWLTAEVFE
jgi:hypothetical protein